MRLLLALLVAVGPATAQDEEGIHCNGRLLPDNKICDGVGDCSEIFPGLNPRFGTLDEDPSICAAGELMTKTLELRSENLANGSVLFTWTWRNGDSPGPYLTGYYFRANSTEETFRETLSSGRLDYTPHQLRRYTTYDIVLRPFYSFYDWNRRHRFSISKFDGALGKAAILTVRTPALAPGAPTKIVPLPPMVDQPDRWGELALAVTGPEAWNSKPLGFHLRWEPAAEGQTVGRGFTFPYLASGTTPTSYDLNVTLSLNPGQEYTVFASAQGLGDYGEVLVGPETSVKIERSNMAPKYLLENTVQLASQTLPNGSMIFSWTWSKGSKPAELGGFHFRSVSAAHTFQTTLSKDDTDFFPAPLRPYTEYEITLKPFYVLNGSVIDTEKLGKPSRINVRTPAEAPGAPSDIVVLPANATSKQDGQLPLAILEPVAWNSKPLSFHLRWDPAEKEEQAGLDISIPAMAANETKTRHGVNVTLLLKPGREYTVFASARGLGDNGEVHVGPETPMKVETTPLAPVDFTTEMVDPSKAVLKWSATSPARSFQVTVTDCRRSEHECNNDSDEKTLQLEPSHSASPAVDTKRALHNSFGDPTGLPVDMFFVRSIPKEAAGTLTDLNTDISIDGSALPSSSYSLPVFGLTPSREYAVRVKACSRDTCSDEVGTVFRTPPSIIPLPELTKVLSNDSKSIYLEWMCPFMEQLVELSPEFQVRVRAPGFFSIVSTAEKALTIGNLSDGTSFEVEVRMSLEVAPGKRKYSGPAKATISTWWNVPLAPSLTTEGFETEPSVAAVSWTFVNSTVTHLQFATNSTDFVNCGSSNDCAVVVLRGWNSSFKAGFVKISRLSPYKKYDIALRGCNAHGCGDATSVHVATAISEPGAPANLKLSSDIAPWAWANPKLKRDILTWNAPLEPAGPISGYWVVWSCDNGPTTCASTDYPRFHVPGLPSEAEECTFSVHAYNVLKHGEELHGEPATLTTPLPAQS